MDGKDFRKGILKYSYQISFSWDFVKKQVQDVYRNFETSKCF